LTKAHGVRVGDGLVNGEEELRNRPEALLLLVRLPCAVPIGDADPLSHAVPFDDVLPLEFGVPLEVVVIVIRVVVLLTTYTTGLLPKPVDVNRKLAVPRGPAMVKLEDFVCAAEKLGDVVDMRPLKTLRLAGYGDSAAPLTAVVSVTVVLSLAMVLVDRTMR